MEWVETTGRTVTEALEAALDQLGVDEQDAEVVILEEPKSGLFGLRKAPARVRARVRPTKPRPKRPQRDRRGRGGRSGGSGAGRGGERSGAPGQQEADRQSDGVRSDSANGQRRTRSGAPRQAEGSGREGVSQTAEGDSDLVYDESQDGATRTGSSSSSRRRRRRSGRGSGSGGSGSSGKGSEGSAEVRDDNGVRGEGQGGARAGSGRSRNGDGRRSRLDDDDARRPRGAGIDEENLMPVEEQAAMARSFVEGVVERLGIPASTTATVSEDEETIDIAVDGEGLGFLIGPHGSTLAALQDLTRTVVQRKTNDRGARILVDVASYRAKRAVALADFTRRIAGDVLASGAAAALEPMSAADRKVVHDTVNDIDGVETSSEGEGDDRHVVIRPTAPASVSAHDAEPDEDAD